MDPFEPIRTAAEELHERVVQGGGDPLMPLEMVERAAALRDLTIEWVVPSSPSLNGARALFDDQAGRIVCANEGSTGDRALLAGHELGHVVLHSAPEATCDETELDASQSIEQAPVGLQKVEDYGARARKELQANVFARAFLLPRRDARRLHLEQNLGASEIAARLSVSLPVVKQQLLDALLLPDGVPVSSAESEPVPDALQVQAAQHRDAPLLLEAGPGTGKTRTLVKRVESLISAGVDPSRILILTFSNRAAGELFERLERALGPRSAKLWVGTFHAFGLELLRRFHVELGLPSDPQLIDRSDAVELLEDALPTLKLERYRELWDPTQVLAPMVSAISRAKDELIDPARYRELGERMLEKAIDEKTRVAAEKVLEVARVYDRYEQLLRDRGAVDFGDLIKRPAELLEADPSVLASIRARHEHILVDEYQDVNRASATLLKLVANDGRKLWVVGDARQSIYRFRGASTVNMRSFETDYPGAKRMALTENYRSTSEVVETFTGFAQAMGASRGMTPLRLHAVRGRGSQPEVHDFEHDQHEAQGIADAVQELQLAGVPFRTQAVLCRTNSRLAEIVDTLEARSIPVLHLGNLFERPEIRELLCVLALVVDSLGDTLVLLGAGTEYPLTMQDTFAASAFLRAGAGPAASRLSEAATLETISTAGRASLLKLGSELDGISSNSTPWEALTTLLLDRTRRLANLANTQGIPARMQAVAIWQFLNFVRERVPSKRGLPIRKVLDRVRRLALFAEDRDLRHVPKAALGIDGVRLMTVHASKGLEFSAVHLPTLVVSHFPANRRGNPCPPPEGLFVGAETDHDEEEESLFFVGLSRARDTLRLSRHRKLANGRNRSPSPFLEHLSCVATSHAADAGRRTEPHVKVVLRSPKLTVSALGLYEKCAARYFYTHALELGRAKQPTAFTKTHSVIQDFIVWLAAARHEPSFSSARAEAEFARLWEEKGPSRHAFAADYRALALELVEFLADSYAGRVLAPSGPLTIMVAGVPVVVEDLEVGEASGRPTLRQTRTGRKRDGEYGRLEYAFLRQAAAGRRLEVVHLTDRLIDEVPPSAKPEKTDKTAELVRTLLAGSFSPERDPHSCPRCPHYFSCGRLPNGPLDRTT